MYTTIESYAAATSTSKATASRRLKGVAYRIPSRERGRRYYHLAAAIQTLKGKEVDEGVVKALTVSARDLFGHDLYVEPEALPLARAFAEWLPSEAMRDRLRAAQNAFVMGVGDSRMCAPTIVRNLPPLRELFALYPTVLAWVLTGGASPDAHGLAAAFAVSNNCAALDNQITIQEAA
ncbi:MULTISPECIES: hypothetical protein [unclassified Sulfitobacter]|uniref:hypothetical protein n=1 Tax=unclassified Sulfitobacter TaxID=196795 RepID=UPI0037454308